MQTGKWFIKVAMYCLKAFIFKTLSHWSQSILLCYAFLQSFLPKKKHFKFYFLFYIAGSYQVQYDMTIYDVTYNSIMTEIALD